MEKKVPLQLSCGAQNSVIMVDFLMLEAQQPIIVIILITYSYNFLKGSCRTLGIYLRQNTYYFQIQSKLQACSLVERVSYYAPCLLIHQGPRMMLLP